MKDLLSIMEDFSEIDLLRKEIKENQEKIKEHYVIIKRLNKTIPVNLDAVLEQEEYIVGVFGGLTVYRKEDPENPDAFSVYEREGSNTLRLRDNITKENFGEYTSALQSNKEYQEISKLNLDLPSMRKNGFNYCAIGSAFVLFGSFAYMVITGDSPDDFSNLALGIHAGVVVFSPPIGAFVGDRIGKHRAKKRDRLYIEGPLRLEEDFPVIAKNDKALEVLLGYKNQEENLEE